MSAVVRCPAPGAVDTHSSPPIVLLVPSSCRYEVIDFRLSPPTSQFSVRREHVRVGGAADDALAIEGEIDVAVRVERAVGDAIALEDGVCGACAVGRGATLVGMNGAPAFPFGCASGAVRVAFVMQRVCVVNVVPAGARCWFGRKTAVAEFNAALGFAVDVIGGQPGR